MKYAYKKKIYILLFTVIDLVGRLLFFWCRKNHKITEAVKRILVVREDHVGDVINATVVLAPIRQRFPNARIDFMVPSWAAELLKGNTAVSNIIEFDPAWFDRSARGMFKQIRSLRAMIRVIRSGNYDLCIDLRGDARHIAAMFAAGVPERISYGMTGLGFLLTREVSYEGKMHETGRNMALLKPLEIEGCAGKVSLAFPESGSILSDSGVKGNYAVIHINPGHDMKKWSTEGFARIVSYLKNDKKLDVVAVGTEKDKKRIRDVGEVSGIEIVDISGKTTLGELGKVISSADIFVGVDSGPSHIAASAGAPTVILFSGVNDPEQWAPRGNNVKVICPGEGRDLSSVTPEEVYKVIDGVI